MSGAQRHLTILAAGTGGHIMPGLAVAREMQRRGWTVSWLGTTTGMENRLVPPSGIALDTVAFAGVRGKGLWQSVQGLFKLIVAMVRSFSLLGQRGADAVLGMGGYVCVPAGIAAKVRGVPMMLVNADASWLMSNKVLLPLVSRIGFGFDGAAASTSRKALVTGNPVRADIEDMAPPSERLGQRIGPLKVLVVGGSLGARVLNQTLPAALALLKGDLRPIVTHQTGNDHHASVVSAYEQAGVEAEILPFIDDMPRRLAECDLIICRAGAITVSELCAGGVASILVPLVISTTAHQRDNAAYMAQHGAAIHLPQTDLSAHTLADQLRALSIDDRRAVMAMAQASRKLSRPKAAERVADEIEAMLTQPNTRRGAA